MHRNLEAEAIEVMPFMRDEKANKQLTPRERTYKEIWFKILDERASMLGSRPKHSAGVQRYRPAARGIRTSISNYRG
jgi:hypothetical protein